MHRDQGALVVVDLETGSRGEVVQSYLEPPYVTDISPNKYKCVICVLENWARFICSRVTDSLITFDELLKDISDKDEQVNSICF